MDGISASARSEIRLQCPCRLIDGVTLELDLRDVSPRGCRVKIGNLPLYVGQGLTIYPEGMDEFTGTVRRADDEFAGIEFDRELPHPVFERLRCNHATSPEDDEEEIGIQQAAAVQDEVASSEDAAGQEPAGGHSQYGSLTAISTTRRKRVFGVKGVVVP